MNSELRNKTTKALCVLCLLFCVPSGRAQSSNKVFTLGTNNVLRPGETNFFAVNSNLLNQAISSGSFGGGGGGDNFFPTDFLTNGSGQIDITGGLKWLSTNNATGLTNLNATNLVGTIQQGVIPASGLVLSNVFLTNATVTNLIIYGYGTNSLNVFNPFGPAHIQAWWAGSTPAQVSYVDAQGGYNILGGGNVNVGYGGEFVGLGAGLTNLNASQLTSGMVPVAQLPTNIIINTTSAATFSNTTQNGSQTFTGTNGPVGNGAGLTNGPAQRFADVYYGSFTISNSVSTGSWGSLDAFANGTAFNPLATAEVYFQSPFSSVSRTITSVMINYQYPSVSAGTNIYIAVRTNNGTGGAAGTAFVAEVTNTIAFTSGNNNVSITACDVPILPNMLWDVQITNNSSGILSSAALHVGIEGR